MSTKILYYMKENPYLYHKSATGHASFLTNILFFLLHFCYGLQFVFAVVRGQINQSYKRIIKS